MWLEFCAPCPCSPTYIAIQCCGISDSDPNYYNWFPFNTTEKRLPGYYPGHHWGTLLESAPQPQTMQRGDGQTVTDGGGDAGGVFMFYDAPGVYYDGSGNDGGWPLGGKEYIDFGDTGGGQLENVGGGGGAGGGGGDGGGYGGDGGGDGGGGVFDS